MCVSGSEMCVRAQPKLRCLAGAFKAPFRRLLYYVNVRAILHVGLMFEYVLRQGITAILLVQTE